MATCKECTHKAECMDENGKTPYIGETIMAGNVENLCERFARKMMNTAELQNKPLIKPPLGLKPAFVVYDERIREICEAIIEIMDPEMTMCTMSYRNIEKWSFELNQIAKLMISLDKPAPRGE